MPTAKTFGSSVGFRYSCSSVYSSPFGISDTVDSGAGDDERRGVYRCLRGVSRNAGGALARVGVLAQRAPHVVHPLGERIAARIVLDDDVGPRALELRRHLRG